MAVRTPQAAASPLSFGTIRDRLRRAAQAGDVAGATEVLDRFHEQVVAAVAERERSRLAELGGQAQRLRHTLERAGGTPELEADLRRVGRTIEIAWTSAALHGTREEPATPPQFTVRGRVLEELRTRPSRPRDIAAALGVDRTQVSRALRELQREGSATLCGQDGHDGRAAYWTVRA